MIPAATSCRCVTAITASEGLVGVELRTGEAAKGRQVLLHLEAELLVALERCVHVFHDLVDVFAKLLGFRRRHALSLPAVPAVPCARPVARLRSIRSSSLLPRATLGRLDGTGKAMPNPTA